MLLEFKLTSRTTCQKLAKLNRKKRKEKKKEKHASFCKRSDFTILFENPVSLQKNRKFWLCKIKRICKFYICCATSGLGLTIANLDVRKASNRFKATALSSNTFSLKHT